MALHALFIAVPEYQHANVSRLPGTQRDAEALHKQFHYGLKCGERAHLLISPTLAEVRRALNTLGQALRQGDTFVLYFSGHGVERPDSKEQHLLLRDAEMEAIEEGEWDNLKDALSDRYLSSQMRRWPPTHQVMIYDACRKPLGHHKSVGEMLPFASEEALQRLVSKDPWPTRRRPAQDSAARPEALSLVYIKSCRSGQKAYEIQGVERGVFGQAVFDDLEDCVAQQRDVVIAAEFVQRVQQRMDGLRSQHGLNEAQEVWMSDCPAPVPLWLSAQGPAIGGRTAPANAAPGLNPQAVSELLATWAEHLQHGRYTEPAWDCCVASLGGLRHIGLPQPGLQALQGVVQQMQRMAERAAEDASKHDQALATAQRQAQTMQSALEQAKAQAVAEASAAAQRHTALEAAASEAQTQLKKANVRLAQLEQRLASLEESKARESANKASPVLPAPTPAPAATPLGGLRKLVGLSATGLADSQTKLLDARRTAHQSAAGAARPPGHRWREADWAPELVWCPPGEFLMGSPDGEEGRHADEGPQHSVRFAQGFWMGRCAISFEEYDRFVVGTQGRQPKDQGWGRGKLPVIDVSWNDAQAYVAWLNLRLGLPAGTYHLPSEAQWEYACRAGTSTPYWWGDTIDKTQANFSAKKTVPVGSAAANPWGLFNVHGNVREWVQDAYVGSYEGAPQDGSARADDTSGQRVLRGGSWNYGPQYLRSANRNWISPVNRFINSGFRIARTFSL